MSAQKKLLIIGAGLSGIYAAVLLQDKYDVTVLEARGRTGGRILNISGHDMGPSWVWEHQTHILQLIDSLGLAYFEQYMHGDSLYDAPKGVQRFSQPPSVPSYRVRGGISQIIHALEAKLYTPVKTNKTVISLVYKEGNIVLTTESNRYEAEKVISTFPPRLALETIIYDPPLEKDIENDFYTYLHGWGMQPSV